MHKFITAGLLVITFSCAFIFCPNLAPANDQNSENNVSCDTELFGKNVVQKNGTFDPRQVMSFNSEVAPLLNNADQLPAFGKALRETLSKNWRMGSDQINNCPSANSYPVSFTLNIACQTSSEVIISPDWYKDLAGAETCAQIKTDTALIIKLKKRLRDLIVYELVLGIPLGTETSQESLNAVFNVVTQSPAPTETELQSALETSHFGVYGTAANPCIPSPPSPLDLQNQGTLTNASRAVGIVSSQACLAPALFTSLRALLNNLEHTSATYFCMFSNGYKGSQMDPKLASISSQISSSLGSADPLIQAGQNTFSACRHYTVCQVANEGYTYDKSCIKNAAAQVEKLLSQRVCE